MRYTMLLLLFVFVPSVLLASTGQKVVYTVDNLPYEGYFISEGADAPLVVLIHDWDGLTDYEVKRAEMLHSLGYSVFAADLFGRGVRPTEVKDKKQHTGELYADREKMRRLLYASLAEAEKLGADVDRAVAMGYCFGGAAVLEFARSGADLKGFVTFHGGLATPEGQDYSKAKGEYLILHGSADSIISLEEFAALGVELNDSKLPNEIISYGGAPHAFTVFGSKKYREDADKKSWARFTDFLETVL